MGIYKLVFPPIGDQVTWPGEVGRGTGRGAQQRQALGSLFQKEPDSLFLGGDDLNPIKVGGGPRREETRATGEGL